MRELLRSAFIVAAVLAVPLLPFLVFGARMQQWIEQWTHSPPAQPVTAAVIVGLLATDIFLPIPSSVISTLGGWQLGWMLGTAASWLGMTIGAALGFALARRFGQPFALWFTKTGELDRMRSLSSRYGPAALVLTRGVPLLAEASVLLMGLHGMTWRQFLPPVVLSNLGIALAYSAFGNIAEQHHWLPLALGISVALPVLLTTLVRNWMPKSQN